MATGAKRSGATLCFSAVGTKGGSTSLAMTVDNPTLAPPAAPQMWATKQALRRIIRVDVNVVGRKIAAQICE
jgi:hypothetical protein